MLRPGDTFAPYEMFNGPVVPLGIFDFPGIDNDDRMVYIFLLNGFRKNSWTQRKYSVIAKSLAMSEDRSGRSMVNLERAGLIRRERQGPGKLSIIHLLWHPLLSASLSKKGQKLILESADSRTLDSAESRSAESALQNPHRCGQDSAKPGGGTPQNAGEIKGKRRNKKDKLRGESSSSVPPEAATRTTTPAQSASQQPETETEPRWWQSVDRQGLQDQLNLVKPSSLAYPARRDVESILADNFEGLEDFRNWIAFVGAQDMSRAGSWAYFKRPAEDWKGQRAGYLAEQEQQRQRQVEWLEQQQRAAMQAAIDIKARQNEWCRACVLEEPCSKHKPQAPTPPKPSATELEARHRTELISELEFQREQAATAKAEAVREWSANRVTELEAELAGLESKGAAA